jgi:hypothetical protein
VAARDVDRTRQGALLVLVGLADVEDDHPAGIDTRLRLGGVDLGDLGLRLRQEITKRGHERNATQSIGNCTHAVATGSGTSFPNVPR